MPHIIVKLWPGKSDRQKKQLSDAITESVVKILNYGEESVSVAFDEVSSANWKAQVFDPEIKAKADQLYKKPGYQM